MNNSAAVPSRYSGRGKNIGGFLSFFGALMVASIVVGRVSNYQLTPSLAVTVIVICLGLAALVSFIHFLRVEWKHHFTPSSTKSVREGIAVFLVAICFAAPVLLGFWVADLLR